MQKRRQGQEGKTRLNYPDLNTRSNIAIFSRAPTTVGYLQGHDGGFNHGFTKTSPLAAEMNKAGSPKEAGPIKPTKL